MEKLVQSFDCSNPPQQTSQILLEANKKIGSFSRRLAPFSALVLHFFPDWIGKGRKRMLTKGQQHTHIQRIERERERQANGESVTFAAGTRPRKGIPSFRFFSTSSLLLLPTCKTRDPHHMLISSNMAKRSGELLHALERSWQKKVKEDIEERAVNRWRRDFEPWNTWYGDIDSVPFFFYFSFTFRTIRQENGGGEGWLKFFFIGSLWRPHKSFSFSQKQCPLQEIVCVGLLLALGCCAVCYEGLKYMGQKKGGKYSRLMVVDIH